MARSPAILSNDLRGNWPCAGLWVRMSFGVLAEEPSLV